MDHLPVGLDPVVNVNADVISDALLLFLSFISNILCVTNKLYLLFYPNNYKDTAHDILHIAYCQS